MPSSDDNASLLRRLAGPSAGKAGLDTQNQERINKIIHDASKGGRFFNNEVKRDQHTSARIDSMKAVLRRRMQGANHASITHTVTAQLRKMETERDLSQYIMHCDMDMFYAAVEVLDNPSLEGKAFGVGKGILTTASYEARKFGIRSAMPCFIAHKLCDHFVEVPMRMERYVEKVRLSHSMGMQLRYAEVQASDGDILKIRREHGCCLIRRSISEVSDLKREMLQCLQSQRHLVHERPRSHATASLTRASKGCTGGDWSDCVDWYSAEQDFSQGGFLLSH